MNIYEISLEYLWNIYLWSVYGISEWNIWMEYLNGISIKWDIIQIFCMGLSIVIGIPKMDGLFNSGKIPSRTGWWPGVPPWLWKPHMSLSFFYPAKMLFQSTTVDFNHRQWGLLNTAKAIPKSTSWSSSSLLKLIHFGGIHHFGIPLDPAFAGKIRRSSPLALLANTRNRDERLGWSYHVRQLKYYRY